MAEFYISQARLDEVAQAVNDKLDYRYPNYKLRTGGHYFLTYRKDGRMVRFGQMSVEDFDMRMKESKNMYCVDSYTVSLYIHNLKDGRDHSVGFFSGRNSQISRSVGFKRFWSRAKAEIEKQLGTLRFHVTDCYSGDTNKVGTRYILLLADGKTLTTTDIAGLMSNRSWAANPIVKSTVEDVTEYKFESNRTQGSIK